MPIEPDEITALLRGAPCHTLDAYQQHLLAARCGAGVSSEEVGALWGYSRATMDREFARICDIVLGRLGLDHNIAIMTQWFYIHRESSLPIADDLIRRRAVFAAPPPERMRRGHGKAS